MKILKLLSLIFLLSAVAPSMAAELSGPKRLYDLLIGESPLSFWQRTKLLSGGLGQACYDNQAARNDWEKARSLKRQLVADDFYTEEDIQNIDSTCVVSGALDYYLPFKNQADWLLKCPKGLLREDYNDYEPCRQVLKTAIVHHDSQTKKRAEEYRKIREKEEEEYRSQQNYSWFSLFWNQSK